MFADESRKAGLPSDGQEELEMGNFSQTVPGCGICGGFQISIRGSVPGADSRIVCPTCLADRMEQIHQTSSPEYGQASTIQREAEGEDAP